MNAPEGLNPCFPTLSHHVRAEYQAVVLLVCTVKGNNSVTLLFQFLLVEPRKWPINPVIDDRNTFLIP